MIASFAFNFNNFNNIFLLTGGGPYSGSSSVAGSTDILISYTYKLAIQTGKGPDYGLASTVGIVIFFIVASISGVSFWRSSHWRTSIERSRASRRNSHRRTRSRAPSRRRSAETQRHLVAPRRRRDRIVVSLFPLVYVISSAFNRDNTLQGASLIPVHVTTTTSPTSSATTSRTRAAAFPTRRTCTGSSTR